jgi:hypothetical protein
VQRVPYDGPAPRPASHTLCSERIAPRFQREGRRAGAEAGRKPAGRECQRSAARGREPHPRRGPCSAAGSMGQAQSITDGLNCCTMIKDVSSLSPQPPALRECGAFAEHGACARQPDELEDNVFTVRGRSGSMSPETLASLKARPPRRAAPASPARPIAAAPPRRRAARLICGAARPRATPVARRGLPGRARA